MKCLIYKLQERWNMENLHQKMLLNFLCRIRNQQVYRLFFHFIICVQVYFTVWCPDVWIFPYACIGPLLVLGRRHQGPLQIGILCSWVFTDRSSCCLSCNIPVKLVWIFQLYKCGYTLVELYQPDYIRMFEFKECSSLIFVKASLWDNF